MRPFAIIGILVLACATAVSAQLMPASVREAIAQRINAVGDPVTIGFLGEVSLLPEVQAYTNREGIIKVSLCNTASIYFMSKSPAIVQIRLSGETVSAAIMHNRQSGYWYATDVFTSSDAPSGAIQSMVNDCICRLDKSEFWRRMEQSIRLR